MASVIPSNFNKMQGAVNKFVTDCGNWRGQINTDGPPADPADLDALSKLGDLEKNLQQDVSAKPLNEIDFRDQFNAVDGHLTEAKNLYSFLVDVSSSTIAETMEKKARKSLKQLIKVMKDVRDQLFPKSTHVTDNLFLDTMKSLVGKGPVKIGQVEFPEVTQDDFDLTRELFKLATIFPGDAGFKELSLKDSKLERLTDSWTTVAAYFVDFNLPRSASSSIVSIEADFFIMHSLLDELYELIATRVERTSVVSAGSVGL